MRARIYKTQSRSDGRLKWGGLNVCVLVCVFTVESLCVDVRREIVCMCVRHSGIIDLLKVQCVCWIRGAGTGLWACKILPQSLSALCLSVSHSHTHTHKPAQTNTQIYIWVLLTLYRLSMWVLLFMPFLWIGDSVWRSASFLGLCKPGCWENGWSVLCNLILSEANESANDWILFLLNFKFTVSAAHLQTTERKLAVIHLDWLVWWKINGLHYSMTVYYKPWN